MLVSWGQSPGMYACFASDFLAKCREQQVANQTRSTALKVRFIVADRDRRPRDSPRVFYRDSPRVFMRESSGTVPGYSFGDSPWVFINAQRADNLIPAVGELNFRKRAINYALLLRCVR
jgi:hypothetical protein